jgi:hypothetical protein
MRSIAVAAITAAVNVAATTGRLGPERLRVHFTNSSHSLGFTVFGGVILKIIPGFFFISARTSSRLSTIADATIECPSPTTVAVINTAHSLWADASAMCKTDHKLWKTSTGDQYGTPSHNPTCSFD